MAKPFKTLRDEMTPERRQRNQREIEQGLGDDQVVEQRLRAKTMGEVKLSLHDLISRFADLQSGKKDSKLRG